MSWLVSRGWAACSKKTRGGGAKLTLRTFAPSIKLPAIFSRDDQLIVRPGWLASLESSRESTEKYDVSSFNVKEKFFCVTSAKASKVDAPINKAHNNTPKTRFPIMLGSYFTEPAFVNDLLGLSHGGPGSCLDFGLGPRGGRSTAIRNTFFTSPRRRAGSETGP